MRLLLSTGPDSQMLIFSSYFLVDDHDNGKSFSPSFNKAIGIISLNTAYQGHAFRVILIVL